MLRALTSHQCGPGSNPGFFSGFSGFSPSTKPFTVILLFIIYLLSLNAEPMQPRSQGLSLPVPKSALGGGRERDPGNEVGTYVECLDMGNS